MKKVRFLQSAFLLNLEKTFGFNDEETVSDAQAESLKKSGLVDILDEKVEAKTSTKARQKAPQKEEEEE